MWATHAKIAPFFREAAFFPGVSGARYLAAPRLFFSLLGRLPCLPLPHPFRSRVNVARAPSSSTPGLTDSSGASNNVASQAFHVPSTPPRLLPAPSLATLSLSLSSPWVTVGVDRGRGGGDVTGDEIKRGEDEKRGEKREREREA